MSAELTPFGMGIKGHWQNITAITHLTVLSGEFRTVKRYIVELECGHRFVIHPDVRQYNGCFFNPSQVAYFCTCCEPPEQFIN